MIRWLNDQMIRRLDDQMIRRSDDQIIRCVEDREPVWFPPPELKWRPAYTGSHSGFCQCSLMLRQRSGVNDDAPAALMWPDCSLTDGSPTAAFCAFTICSPLGEEPSGQSQRGYQCVLWSCLTGVYWRTLEGGCSLKRLVKPPNFFILLIFSEILRFWEEIFVCEALRAETQPALFLLGAVKHHDPQGSACTYESLVCNPQTHITEACGDTTVYLPGLICWERHAHSRLSCVGCQTRTHWANPGFYNTSNFKSVSGMQEKDISIYL